MKAVLGIDTAGVYKPALKLLGRLQFSDLHLLLAHSVDVVVPVPLYGIGAEIACGADLVTCANELGKEALDHAKEAVAEYGVQAETVTLTGNAALALTELADHEAADLIAIHAEKKGTLSQLFLGSVARGLAIGAHQSLLISKGERAQAGELTAVFATDHSSYGEKSLEEFLRLRPAGIKRVHVVSAVHLSDYALLSMHYDLGRLGTGVEEQMERHFQTRNEAWLEKLAAAGYEASDEVVVQSPNTAIASAMRAVSADLLILGAQGHGFMHRLFIGSTSLHQVVAEPHPVLLLRPRNMEGQQ